MMFALVRNKTVFELFSKNPDLPAGAPVYDVSSVKGISVGWIANADGTYSAPTPTKDVPKAADLIQYANMLLDTKLSVGIQVNVKNTDGTSNALTVDTTTTGRTNLLGLESLAAKGQPIVWIQATGPINLTATQIEQVAICTGNYVSNVYSTWGSIVADINSNPPTITDIDQINMVSWPPVTY